MNKCYVVYTKYEQDMVDLNDLKDNIQIEKVFNKSSINYATMYVKNELEFQCDKIIYPNGNIWQKVNDKCSWVAKLKETSTCLLAEVYYNDELQYAIYVKETEVA